ASTLVLRTAVRYRDLLAPALKFSVTHSRSSDRIADQRNVLSSLRSNRELEHVRMNMDSVGDDIERDIRICKRPSNDTDVAVMKSGHRVVKVSEMFRTGFKCTLQ